MSKNDCDYPRLKHCVKRIAHLLLLMTEEFDDFCDALGITTEGEEVKKNGVDNKDNPKNI